MRSHPSWNTLEVRRLPYGDVHTYPDSGNFNDEGLVNTQGTICVLVAFFLCFLFLSKGVLAGPLEPFGEVPFPPGNPHSLEKADLGKKLFFDRRLSGDGSMSCSSCHNPAKAFTDGQDISFSYPATKNWRNAPTLLNAVFYQSLFHDGRAETLEEQALFPIRSPFEMNRNFDFMEEVLRSVPEYVDAFRNVFGGEITRERVAMALASFERTLFSRNVPLHRFLKGEKEALSAEALKGLGIFEGKGSCIRCHNGSILSDNGFHALEVPENPKYRDEPGVAATRRLFAREYGYGEYRTLKEDPGRFLITQQKQDWKAFRTPTLLEIAKTAPYMHNGVFKTLDEVIDFIDRGGGMGNRELHPLGLSKEEKGYLKAFLVEALSGDEIIVQKPEIP